MSKHSPNLPHKNFDLFTTTTPSDTKSCYVAFYNAQSSKDLEMDEIFALGEKVLLITQHASASNGVNLQYTLNGTRKDYEGISILDPQYFFFSEQKEADDKESPYETNIYHLKKLEVSDALTRSDFEYHMREFSWEKVTNKFYRDQLPDRILGHFVLISQVMGRIEREWSAMSSTEVRLSENVWVLLERFIKGFNDFYETRKPIMSGIMRAMMETLESKMDRKDINNYSDAQDVSATEEKVENKITYLLNQIERLKKGELTSEEAEDVHKVWGTIRVKALQHDHDFSTKRLKRFGIEGNFFSYQTRYLNQATYYFKEGCILPEPDATAKLIDLNKLYEPVRKNPTIKRYFEKRGYHTSFSTVNRYENYVFSYLFRQSILQGAIGEEGIKALLSVDPDHPEPDTGVYYDSEAYKPYIPIEKEICDELFEVMDIKIKGAHIYIDAKNWRDSIVRKFYLQDDDYDGALHEINYVPKVKEKLAKIRTVTGVKNVKLIFVILSHPSDQPKRSNELYCYDDNKKPVSSYQEASIVWVAGAVRAENPAEWHPAFVQLVKHIKEDISGSKKP